MGYLLEEFVATDTSESWPLGRYRDAFFLTRFRRRF
jgi:hypothetical protein